MKFRTEIEVERSHSAISHADNLLLIGSCFSENIGRKLVEGGFCTQVNPLGIVYNPMSVKASLQRLISSEPYVDNELLFYNEVWHSFDHHGKFSHHDKGTCLAQINSSLRQGHQQLKKARHLLVTFGTAWVFRHLQLDKIVSNCHKYPAATFIRERLSVDMILAQWGTMIEQLHDFNPDVDIIFTVSPVRHWKDGAHGNQISKSILHLAIDALCEKFPFCHYFPAYELVLDDLRDYRFFSDDMLHPNSQAVDYIWEKFSAVYFNATTTDQIKQVKKIKQAAAHRALKPDNDAYRQFALKQLSKIEAIRTKYPNLLFEQETDYFKSVLK